jgi:hypothetical protein
MRCLSFAAMLLILAAGSAAAADLTTPAVVTDAYAVCASGNALARIKHTFARAEETLWHRGFVIETIENPRPSGHPYNEPGLVKRDYCVADTVMTNGAAHPVYYVIEHGLGFVGIGTDVDSCVPGLDPWHIYDGSCRTVR